MTQQSDSAWAWITRFDSVGFCLSFAENRSATEMLAAFGVDGVNAEMMTLEEAGDEFGFELPVIRAGQSEGWGFAFEDMGRQGSTGQALAELSTGTRAVSVWRVANGLARFSLVVDGVVVCAFDPGEPERRVGSDPDRLVSGMRRVGFDPDVRPAVDSGSPVVAALELASREFGVRLPGDIIWGPLLTGEVEIDMSWLDD